MTTMIETSGGKSYNLHGEWNFCLIIFLSANLWPSNFRYLYTYLSWDRIFEKKGRNHDAIKKCYKLKTNNSKGWANGTGYRKKQNTHVNYDEKLYFQFKKKFTTYPSSNVLLTNEFVNDVFPTARNPRIATFRCKSGCGSHFTLFGMMCH